MSGLSLQVFYLLRHLLLTAPPFTVYYGGHIKGIVSRDGVSTEAFGV
jgi:hypothetical protein